MESIFPLACLFNWTIFPRREDNQLSGLLVIAGSGDAHGRDTLRKSFPRQHHVSPSFVVKPCQSPGLRGVKRNTWANQQTLRDWMTEVRLHPKYRHFPLLQSTCGRNQAAFSIIHEVSILRL
jgi:hypothetical protein